MHVAVSGDASGERATVDFKAYATRRLVREGLVPQGRRVWTEGGSARTVRWVEELERVQSYVNEQ